jgi:thiosulfate reductase cytochrome b subunit
MIAFVIAHVYLTTTGHTVTSNLKAMITGWEELDEEDDGEEIEEK